MKPTGESQDLSIQSVKCDSNYGLVDPQKSAPLTGMSIPCLPLPTQTKPAEGALVTAPAIQIRAPQSIPPPSHQPTNATPLIITPSNSAQVQITTLNCPAEKYISNSNMSTNISHSNISTNPGTPTSLTTSPVVKVTTQAIPAAPIPPKKSRFTVKTIPVVEVSQSVWTICSVLSCSCSAV